MKFIHLADLHLSDNFKFDSEYSAYIRENTRKSFENILYSNKDVDFALIAGDLFERNYFTSKDFEKLFEIFINFGKDIYYVTGNHDYFDKYNTVFLNYKPNNLHIFTDEKLSLFEKYNVRIYGLSYKDRIYNKDFDYELMLDNNFFNILLAHADISENKTNYLNLNIKKLINIGFDYIALGHIHKANNIYNIYYSGSIEPLDFSHLYQYGYIKYDEGNINYIDSSIMKFNIINIISDNFRDEDEIIDNINNKLIDKVNFIRINIKGSKDFNLKFIRSKINAYYVEIVDLREIDNIDNIIRLYPDSLIDKFDKKFIDKNNDIYKKARKIGIDAILRSKK